MSTMLVTGGAGYIGSHISFLLAQQGHTVIVIDSFLHHQTVAMPWATIVRADYADAFTLEHLFTTYKIDAVMHCAALIEVGRSVVDPLACYENNVSKTIVLLQFMMKHNVKKIIFSSSCAVYGNPQWVPLTENHPQHPVSPYGHTKAMIESVLHDVAQAYGLSYVCLRYFNAAGATPEHSLGEQHEPETHLIPLLLQAAVEKKLFNVFGNDYQTADGTAIRDFLHVKDIAQAHYKAWCYLDGGGASTNLNLGTGTGYSVRQMIEMVEEVVGLSLDVVWSPRRKGDPPLLIANAQKARQVLGWEPQHSQIKEIIASAYAYMRDLKSIVPDSAMNRASNESSV